MYSFGAVIEEFQVQDALDIIFAEKDYSPIGQHPFAVPQQIAVH